MLDFADDDDKSSLLFCGAVVFMALLDKNSPYLTLVLNPGLHFLIADARKVKDPLWPKSSII